MRIFFFFFDKSPDDCILMPRVDLLQKNYNGDFEVKSLNNGQLRAESNLTVVSLSAFPASNSHSDIRVESTIHNLLNVIMRQIKDITFCFTVTTVKNLTIGYVTVMSHKYCRY